MNGGFIIAMLKVSVSIGAGSVSILVPVGGLGLKLYWFNPSSSSRDPSLGCSSLESIPSIRLYRCIFRNATFGAIIPMPVAVWNMARLLMSNPYSICSNRASATSSLRLVCSCSSM